MRAEANYQEVFFNNTSIPSDNQNEDSGLDLHDDNVSEEVSQDF